MAVEIRDAFAALIIHLDEVIAWTMDSDEVWDKTHKQASISFKFLGILIFITIF